MKRGFVRLVKKMVPEGKKPVPVRTHDARQACFSTLYSPVICEGKEGRIPATHILCSARETGQVLTCQHHPQASAQDALTRAQRLEKQAKEKQKEKEKEVIASLQGQYLEMVLNVNVRRDVRACMRTDTRTHDGIALHSSLLLSEYDPCVQIQSRGFWASLRALAVSQVRFLSFELRAPWLW
jgi:hypothetical protein